AVAASSGFTAEDLRILRHRRARVLADLTSSGDLALAQRFRSRFEACATDVVKTMVICAAAEIEMLRSSGRLKPPDPEDAEAAERVAGDWRGWSAGEVACWL